MRIDRCNGHDYCLEEKAALDALKGNSVVVATNRIRFDSHKYGAEAIIKDSTIKFFPVMTKLQVEVPLKIQRTEV